MLKLSIRHRLGQWLAVAALLGFVGFGAAMAQSEPTINQIYEAAQAGKVEQAQTMVQQVLVAHPNSAKAHFVQAELFARQGQASRAREALVTADKLAPGLPFAKPEAVQALRTQLASRPTPSNQPAFSDANRAVGAGTGEAAAPASSFSPGLGLALGGGAIALVIFLIRKKSAAAPLSQAAYASQGPASGTLGSGLSGPQTFGAGSGGAPAYGQPAYGQPGYGQPGYGQPAAGSGMGGRVMGGLATGLAVGAGVMAAQAIGKNLMGNNEHPAHLADGVAPNGYQPFAENSDMGGQNFGVNDSASWDDGSSSADIGGGGGDWDT